jgi:hypothetical protein
MELGYTLLFVGILNLDNSGVSPLSAFTVKSSLMVYNHDFYPQPALSGVPR